MITIVGAGPAGCYAGYCLSKQGKKVSIIEEHKKIGSPIQCTGIVTSSLNNIIKPKKSSVINTIRTARIFAGKRFAEFRLKNPNLILDRQEFDSGIAEMAQKEGAKIFAGERFLKNTKSKIITSKRTMPYSHLIGADGPLSSVAKANNMLKKRKFLHGIQARVKIKNENIVEYYPEIGTTAWLVPETRDTARIGLMAPKNASIIFKKFLKRRAGKSRILEYQSGLIPLYSPKQKTQKDNIYLVGDAAGQVKATTGGGIIQGLKAAECLASCIEEKRNYEAEWRKILGTDLWLHLAMRKLMDRFSKRDWARLVRMFSRKKSRKIIEEFDRDYPSSFLLKLLFQNPSLVLFAKCLLQQPDKQKSF